jgi:hypothetical protein
MNEGFSKINNKEIFSPYLILIRYVYLIYSENCFLGSCSAPELLKNSKISLILIHDGLEATIQNENRLERYNTKTPNIGTYIPN